MRARLNQTMVLNKDHWPNTIVQWRLPCVSGLIVPTVLGIAFDQSRLLA